MLGTMTTKFATSLLLVLVWTCAAERSFACDYSISGEISFAEFQNRLNSATYVDVQPGIRFCLAAGTQIVNAENSTTGTLVISKDDIQIVGDPAAPASIVNRRITGSLWESTALHFNRKKNGVLENLKIRTEGPYGVGVFVQGSHLKSIKNVNITTTGPYAAAFRVESVGSDYPHGDLAVVDFIQQLRLEAVSQTPSTPFQTVRRAKFGYINGLEVELPSAPTTSPSAVSLSGTEIKSLRKFTLNNVGSFGFSVNSASSIGVLEDGTITARGTSGRAIYIQDSDVGYLADIRYTNQSYTGNAPFFFSTADIGSISKVSSTSGATSPQAFFLSSSLVGTSYCLTANGGNATKFLAQSLIKYDVPCPNTKGFTKYDHR